MKRVSDTNYLTSTLKSSQELYRLPFILIGFEKLVFSFVQEA